jgi:hypothetical protein
VRRRGEDLSQTTLWCKLDACFRDRQIEVACARTRTHRNIRQRQRQKGSGEEETEESDRSEQRSFWLCRAKEVVSDLQDFYEKNLLWVQKRSRLLYRRGANSETKVKSFGILFVFITLFIFVVWALWPGRRSQLCNRLSPSTVRSDLAAAQNVVAVLSV